jgi:CHAT domain-containing protein
VPIHAAGIYQGANQECCSDYFVSSYTPTLTALMRAQRDAPTLSSQNIRLLAVAAEKAQEPNLAILPSVSREARTVVDAFTNAGASSSDGSESAISDVMAMMESAHIVHLACHGIQDKSEPHKSHFCLSTGNLSVSQLMDMDLKHAFLAFLSACETGKGDREHADEVIHLAATMLFAGFKSVVATMW